MAHSGTCLTIVAKDASTHTVQASAETLARTTLGRWRQGHRLNLERSLRLGDELGGHLIFGHVDAVGEIARVEPDGECRRVEILDSLREDDRRKGPARSKAQPKAERRTKRPGKRERATRKAVRTRRRR